MQVKNAMFEYGRHLGLAFQVVDDILDFTTHADLLGKPQVSTFCIQYEFCCYEKWAGSNPVARNLHATLRPHKEGCEWMLLQLYCAQVVS